MNARYITKKTIGYISAYGTGASIATLMNGTKRNKIDMIAIPIAAFFLGGMVGTHVQDYAEDQVDLFFAGYDKFKADISAKYKK